MSDREIFVGPDGLEAFPDNKRPLEPAQGEGETRYIAFYSKQGEVILVEPPTEEEIDELLYRLESGEIQCPAHKCRREKR